MHFQMYKRFVLDVFDPLNFEWPFLCQILNFLAIQSAMDVLIKAFQNKFVI